MTDAITYGNLLLKLGETSLSIYQLSIVEEAGKHGLMSVSAETEEGAKEYLLYEEYGDMALYANLGQALQPIFYGIVTQMEIKAIGSRCAVYPETVILSCFIDLMVLFSFISAKIPSQSCLISLQIWTHQLCQFDKCFLRDTFCYS